MRTEITFFPIAGITTELLAVLAADTQTAKGPDAKPQPTLLTTDAAVEAAAAAVLGTGEYKAGKNETVLIHAPVGLGAKRLLIVGLGKLAKATVHGVREAAGISSPGEADEDEDDRRNAQGAECCQHRVGCAARASEALMDESKTGGGEWNEDDAEKTDGQVHSVPLCSER